MSIWVVIPVKPFAEGKTRLAPVLGVHERHALNQAFLADTLRTVLAVVPAQHVVVTSRSPEALAMARQRGAQALAEDTIGLNAALETGARLARDAGADSVLSLSTDLPLLTRDDLQRMLDASSSSSIAIAGDRRGTGTNALLLRPPKLIAYAYGEDSLAAHARAANAVQAAVSFVARPGLQFDIDTPEDWHAWQALKNEREHRRRGFA